MESLTYNVKSEGAYVCVWGQSMTSIQFQNKKKTNHLIRQYNSPFHPPEFQTTLVNEPYSISTLICSK